MPTYTPSMLPLSFQPPELLRARRLSRARFVRYLQNIVANASGVGSTEPGSGAKRIVGETSAVVRRSSAGAELLNTARGRKTRKRHPSCRHVSMVRDASILSTVYQQLFAINRTISMRKVEGKLAGP